MTNAGVPTVLLLTTLRIGSPEKYAIWYRIKMLRGYLSSAGYPVVVVTPDGPLEGDSSEGAREGKATPTTRSREASARRGFILGAAATTFVRALRYMSGHRQRRFILLSHDIWTGTFALILSALHPGTPTHLDVPGIPAREIELSHPRLWRAKRSLYRTLFEAVAKRSCLTTTINAAHARYIKRLVGRDALVVPDCLDEAWFSRLAAIPGKEPGDTTFVLYVGSVSRSRLDVFLQGVEPLLKSEHIRVDIVGDGPDLARYKAQYESLGVRFHGYRQREQVAIFLEGADICYSDVWSEIGTPYKVIEYMTAGRTTVAVETESTRELINSGVDGVLCPSTPQELALAIRNLILAPSVRTELGKNARRTAIRRQSGDYGRQLAYEYKKLTDLILR